MHSNRYDFAGFPASERFCETAQPIGPSGPSKTLEPQPVTLCFPLAAMVACASMPAQ